MLITDLLVAIHVPDLPAHVRHDAELGAARGGDLREVVRVERVPARGVHVHRLRVGVDLGSK